MTSNKRCSHSPPPFHSSTFSLLNMTLVSPLVFSPYYVTINNSVSICKLYKWNRITLYLISCSFLLIFYIFKIDSYWYMQVVTRVLDCMDIIGICALSCWWISWVFTIFFCYKQNGSKYAAIPVQISLGTSISQSFSRESWQTLMHPLSLLTELRVF